MAELEFELSVCTPLPRSIGARLELQVADQSGHLELHVDHSLLGEIHIGLVAAQLTLACRCTCTEDVVIDLASFPLQDTSSCLGAVPPKSAALCMMHGIR